MKSLTDAEIIHAVKAGNSTAFRQIVIRYQPLVAKTIVGMLGNCMEVEDVGQETFVRFYRSIDNFRGDSSVGTYICRIAINLSLNELRKRKRKRTISMYGQNKGDTVNTLAISEVNNYETEELVQKALTQLDEKYKAVIVLRLLDGYSTQETADILEIPLGTVLSRLSRGQKQLRAIIKQEKF